MDNIQSYSDFLGEDKPAGAPDFHHSDAPDANGRFRDLSPKDLAAWLIKTRKKDVKKISGSLTQQVVFNRNEDPEYAEKMEKTRKEVYKQLGRQDLLDNMDESLLVERLHSGEEVWNHIVDITPEEDDIPWGFEDQIKNREFQMTKVDLKKLLKTDPDFKDYYKAGKNRYADVDTSEFDLDFEIVVVDGELLDGYSRASQLLGNGVTKAYAFVAEDYIKMIEELVEEGKIRVDLKRIMTKIMGSLEFKTNPKVRQELLTAIKGDVEEILNKHGYEMFEADKKPGPDGYMTGLDDETEEEKKDAMKTQAKMDDDDPEAYKDLPGDKEAREEGRVKKSKHTSAYHKKYKNESMKNLKSFDEYKSSKQTSESVKSLDIDESVRIGKVVAIKKYNAKSNRYERVDVRITDYIKKPGSKDFVEYELKGKKRKIAFKLFKGMMESLVVEEKAKGDRGPIDDSAIEKGLKNKAEETGVPIGLIRIIMRRGMAAWKSGHRPGATQQQWGYARVNSFLTKQEGTWGGADSDVAKEVRDGGHDKNLKKG